MVTKQIILLVAAAACVSQAFSERYTWQQPGYTLTETALAANSFLTLSSVENYLYCSYTCDHIDTCIGFNYKHVMKTCYFLNTISVNFADYSATETKDCVYAKLGKFYLVAILLKWCFHC